MVYDWSTNPATFSLTIDPAYTVVNTYYLLSTGTALVTATKPDGKAGSIYQIYSQQNNLLTFASSTTTPFMDFADNLNNFVRIGSDKMFWYFKASSGGSGFTATIDMSEFNAGSAGTLEDVSLSGNKAVLLWTGKIVYLKIIGDNSVKKIHETTSTGLTLTG